MKINEAYQCLRETYLDWSDFLANPQYVRQTIRDGSHIITWANRVSLMLDHPVMSSDITRVVDERQYTFQVVADGSVFQIYYKYDRKGIVLQSARLAFYCARIDDQILPELRLDPGDAKSKSVYILDDSNSDTETDDQFLLESSTRESERTEIINDGGNINSEDIIDISENKLPQVEDEAGPFSLKNAPISWLRIDYEPTAVKGILHHECHMHLSSFPYARCVVAGVPNPRQFVEFVMSICYPETYKNHRLNEHGEYTHRDKITKINSTCFPTTESPLFKQIAHLRIPAI